MGRLVISMALTLSLSLSLSQWCVWMMSGWDATRTSTLSEDLVWLLLRAALSHHSAFADVQRVPPSTKVDLASWMAKLTQPKKSGLAHAHQANPMLQNHVPVPADPRWKWSLTISCLTDEDMPAGDQDSKITLKKPPHKRKKAAPASEQLQCSAKGVP